MFSKTTATFVEKRKIADQVFEYDFKVLAIQGFVPGQYANIKVDAKAWRSYSIISIDGDIMHLLIDLKPHGIGSLFFEKILPGHQVEMVYPLGDFKLLANDLPKFFVATGTGIVPFIPMVKSLSDDVLAKSILMWGTRFESDIYFDRYVDVKKFARVITCITKPTPEFAGFSGRVTKALVDLNLIDNAFDYYVCGSPAMVDDVRRLLSSNGVFNINFERY